LSFLYYCEYYRNDFIWFSDEKFFSVAASLNMQND